jgi:hypothetical protein
MNNQRTALIGETNFSRDRDKSGIGPTIAREGSKIDFGRRGQVDSLSGSFCFFNFCLLTVCRVYLIYSTTMLSDQLRNTHSFVSPHDTLHF